eukprot:316567_1
MASKENNDKEDNNINQICLCGRKLTQYPHDWNECHTCCKETESETTYYTCRFKASQCTYRELTGHKFKVCSACYETINSSIVDAKHSFIFCKVASLIEQIRQENKQCKNNDERRRYMFYVYQTLYNNCIAKLQKVMNETEYEELQHVFNTFYGGVMDEIKRNIDSMELGLARDIFVNKKNMKRKEWVRMKRISLKWHILCEEHKFEKETDEKV